MTLGDEDNPYRISSVDDIELIRKYPNSSFILTDNINMENKGSLIKSSEFDKIDNFHGILDGNGKTIRNIKRGPLFNRNKGVIKNLSICNSLIEKHRGTTGTMVELNRGTIKSCFVSSRIISDYSAVGGVVGSNKKGVIKSTQSVCKIEGRNAVGGIAGENIYGSIIGCCSNSEIEGESKVGGITGECFGIDENKIEKCSSSGSIKCEKSFVGGITGEADLPIIKCHSESDIFSYRTAGGLIGYNKSDLKDSYFHGKVEGQPDGAIIGENRGEVTNVYSTKKSLNSSSSQNLIGRNIKLNRIIDITVKEDIDTIKRNLIANEI